MKGLGTILGEFLGSENKQPSLTQEEKIPQQSTSNEDKLPQEEQEKTPVINFNLATESLGKAASSLRRIMDQRATGPLATATQEAPSEVQEEKRHKEELGGSAPEPGKGESMRRFAARTEQDLPLVPVSTILIKLLEEGKIQEFNQMRPAGRLDLSGICLAKRNLSGVDFRYCELSRADLRNVDLSHALLQHATLDRTNLEGSTLTEAKFFEAVLTHVNLKRVKDAGCAQFVKADLSYSELQESKFDNAVFTEAKLNMSHLEHASFKRSLMSKAQLARTVVNHTIFEGAILDEARFYQARGRDVNFKNAILVGAEAVGSEFTSSKQKLENGIVLQSTFEGAWTQDFVHRGAIADAILANSKRHGLPPKEALPNNPIVDQGKVLIDGLPNTDKVLYDAGMSELNKLIGLKDFKALVPQLLSHIKVSLAREQMGLPGFDRKLHYVLVGPPGVGKTTCARIMGKLFRSLGVLSEGHVIETDKSGFISGYAGQTLSKTNELIDDALGGVLIADEIYALTDTKNDDYAKDAIVVMVKRMWDDRFKFSAFFLGYPKQMKDFIAANPGFDRRLAGIIEFPPNTSGELVDIFKMKMKKYSMDYSPAMLGYVSAILAINKELKQERFGNAGTVENLVEDLSKRMSQRIDREGLIGSKKALIEATLQDLPSEIFAKLSISELPDIDSLRWVDASGKEFRYNEIDPKNEFPNLSENSLELLREVVRQHSLVDIETGH
jgi:stage V sporulation protein K